LFWRCGVKGFEEKRLGRWILTVEATYVYDGQLSDGQTSTEACDRYQRERAFGLKKERIKERRKERRKKGRRGRRKEGWKLIIIIPLSL